MRELETNGLMDIHSQSPFSLVKLNSEQGWPKRKLNFGYFYNHGLN